MTPNVTISTPLGTMYYDHVKSWVIVIIGTGYIIEPRSVGETGPWSHWHAFCQMLKRQERGPEVMSVTRRRNMVGVAS